MCYFTLYRAILDGPVRIRLLAALLSSESCSGRLVVFEAACINIYDARWLVIFMN